MLDTNAKVLRPPGEAELREVFTTKHGPAEKTGPAPRRRLRYGYFSPDDHYEAVVNGLVTEGIRWLDVGGGTSPFPYNRPLAEQLTRRAGFVAGVDPSDNIRTNPFVTEFFQGFLEDYVAAEPFDLATLRMVAEHVEDPVRFIGALGRLVRPGGRVVVFTVSGTSPITLVSRWTPFWMHHRVKRAVWGGEEKDTFPTVYRMNSRKTLARLFQAGGFAEVMFLRLDDCAASGGFRLANHAELTARRLLRAVRIPYPEACLLGVYERTLS